MSELREKIGKGLLLGAMAVLMVIPSGCSDTEDVTFVPPSDSTDSSDPGAQGLVENHDTYMRDEEMSEGPDTETEDGQR